MVNLSPGFHSFNGGEWSKRLWGRIDLAKYLNAARRCENFIPLVQGPLTKRPGFRFVAPARSTGEAPRLIPFVFSDSDALVIELTPSPDGTLANPGQLRFYRDEGLLLEDWLPLQAVSQAPVAAATCTGHGYASGDEVYLRGAEGMAPLNGRRSVITVQGSDDFALDEIDSSGFPAYAGNGEVARVHRVQHDYDAAELRRLKWVQSLDVLYLFCPGRPVRKLSRLDAGSLDWLLEDVVFEDGPYLAENTTATTVTVAAAGSGFVTLTFNATDGINGGRGFSASAFPADGGRLVRWLTKSGAAGSEKYAWAVGRITAIGSDRVVTAELLVAQASNSVARDGKAWRLGAWSDHRGWPTCGAFYKGRLWVGQTLAHPETVWGSAVDGYQNFAPTRLEQSEREGALPLPTAADAIALTAGGEEASQIRWLAPVAALAVGTSGGEKTIRGSSNAEAVTAENAAILPASTVGVADLPPARVDGTVLFISRDRRRLHELAYNLQADGYVAPEMTILAGHLGDESPLAEIVFQRRPWRILWARRDDGVLLGFTYDREQEVTAWHRHTLGGGGRVVAMTTIPAGAEDRLWVVVERGAGESLTRSVEFLEADGSLKLLADAAESFHVDCGVGRTLAGAGPGLGEVTLLQHLEGREVTILADGAVHPPRLVAGGRVLLERPARRVVVGLAYASRYESLNLEPPLGGGSALGRPKTLTAVDLFVIDTLGGRVGPGEGALEPLLARRDGQAMDRAPPLLTGVQRLEWRGGWRREKRLVFVHDQPLPCTLAGMVPQLSINEG